MKATTQRPSSTILPPDHAAMLSPHDVVTAAPGGILTRTLLDSGRARLVLFTMDEGQELTEHSTPCRAIVQLWRGACELTVEGRTHRLAAGDLMHLPPAAPHAVRATEPLVFLLTLVREGAAKRPSTRAAKR